jgi:hypothetical protein
VTVKIFFRHYQETLTPFDREVDDGYVFPHSERRQVLPPLRRVLHRLGW